MKKNSEQEALLAELAEIHNEGVNKRAEMRRKIEAEYEAKLESIRIRKAVLMVDGLNAGISKTKLGRAVGTTDWKTVEGLLELGRKLHPEPEVERFSWATKMLDHGGLKYAFLSDSTDFVSPTFDNGVITGEGYMYWRALGAWKFFPEQKAEEPEGAAEWVAQNEPEE